MKVTNCMGDENEECDRAGTHGDPRWPHVRFCLKHRSPGDVLLVGDVPVPPQQPRDKTKYVDPPLTDVD